jgi:hypothetical protein
VNDTIFIDGREHLVRDDGTVALVDARPPAGYTPGEAAPVGNAMLPCRICREPLALALARRGAHLGCLPDDQAYGLLRICGADRIWTIPVTVYSGERPHKRAPRETRDSKNLHRTRRVIGGAVA